MAEDQHCSDVRSIAEGNEVILTFDSGEQMELTCTRKTTHHEETVNIIEQNDWYFEDEDGTEYNLCIIEGISGIEGESPFPDHIPLFNYDEAPVGRQIPDDLMFGYVTEVSFESEPTGADPDGTVDTAKP